MTPDEAMAAWPSDRPLVTLRSGRLDHRQARWSILACPRGWFHHTDGRSIWIDTGDRSPIDEWTHEPIADLDRILEATRSPTASSELPFVGGWIGMFSYELGRVIEPAARFAGRRCDPSGWPLICLAWCPDALVFDHVESCWWRIGDPPSIAVRDQPEIDVTIAPLEPIAPPDAHVDAVRRTIDFIGAGDIFQANITQRFRSAVTGSTRDLARLALTRSGAWYGALLELPDDRGVISLSPELFLEVDPATRLVRTRPIKGTRASDRPIDELARSEKDAAELHMIVDLMRNDLGRVCEYGTVRVPIPRAIETHPTVHHGVAEIEGRLRPGVSMGDLLRATFPGGSITGAPKIRAMQIIESLEPFERGPYCGSIGFIGCDGRATLNIAIRTMLLRDRRQASDGRMTATLEYTAGGGIVADSDPVAEWQESLDKARVIEVIRAAIPIAADQ